MFRLAAAFIFQWGAGRDVPVVAAATYGPFWVDQVQVHPHRVYPILVDTYHVAPGKVWSTDPTLETFRELVG